MTVTTYACVAAYLLVGLNLATFGVIGKDIRKEFEELRDGSAPKLMISDEPYVAPPRWKLFVLVMFLGLGATIAWPIFLYSGFNRKK